MSAVLTGVGIVHPHGVGLAAVADALQRGTPPPGRNGAVPRGPYPQLSRAAGKPAAVARYVHGAASLALCESGFWPLPEPEATALVGGTAWGGLEACAQFHEELVRYGPDGVNPSVFVNTAHNVPLCQAAISLGIRGPALTLASGLTAGLEAIIWACRMLRGGQVRTVVAGGFDRLFPALYTAFVARGLLADGGRWGAGEIHPSEGACFFVVEDEESAENRGAMTLARVLGYAQASDVRGRKRGEGLARALRAALTMAGDPRPLTLCLGRAGLGSYDDTIETAYRSALGDEAAVFQRLVPKEILGETFGAGGPFAVAAAIAAGRQGSAVVVDSLGWGGASAVLVLQPSPSNTLHREASA
jgi:3-oxoacyl-(acyl-carrier-protein) synthase